MHVPRGHGVPVLRLFNGLTSVGRVILRLSVAAQTRQKPLLNGRGTRQEKAGRPYICRGERGHLDLGSALIWCAGPEQPRDDPLLAAPMLLVSRLCCVIAGRCGCCGGCVAEQQRKSPA